MSLPEHLRVPTSPLAPDASVVVAGHARFTVLGESLVRCEWSPDGVFEDRPSQVVLHRDLPTPTFRVERDGERTQIFTRTFHLDHDGREFSPASLAVKQLQGGYHSVWRPGQEPTSAFARFLGLRNNLGGTARTLDAVDGAIDLEPGLASELGITALDDSSSLLLTDDGWVAGRRGGAMDFYVFAHGHDYPAAIADFYRISGPQPVVPRWALGNWWSRYHRYTDTEYRGLVERFEAERLPFSVAVIDMDWHLTDVDPRYGAGWTGYTWNRELFPDPQGFMAWLHEHGMRVSLNTHPAEGVRGFEERYPQVARAMGIDPASDLPVTFDAANPDFWNTYFTQLHHPMEAEGVDFWWLDWQQGATSRIDGLDPLWMLNHLHFLDSARDGQRPMTFSRYAGPGSHRYPIGFSGDTVISWESLAFQPYFTATASNIGYGWWSHDIGGHMFGTKDDELATRWVQLGVFSPINRLHSTNNFFNGKEPWRFGPRERAVMGDFLRLRHRMVPWLFTENVVGSRELFPLVRPMYWDDAEVLDSYLVDNQFWLGRDLVVAPITRPAVKGPGTASVEAWLPQGRWTDLFTNLTYSGGRRITLHRPLESIPVLARAGAIIPLTGPDELGVGHPSSLELRIVAGADGHYELIEDDNRATPSTVTTGFTWRQSDGTLMVEPARGDLSLVPPVRRYRVVLLGVGDERVVEVGDVVTATGARVVVDGPFEPDNQLVRRVTDFLDRAEIEFQLKDACLSAVRDHSTAGRRMAVLTELGLETELLGALTELVLALE